VSISPSYFWRCSKSGRARESGEDFTQAFNETLGSPVFAEKAVPYHIDADNYFRPWKIYEAESKIAKQHCTTQHGAWFEIALKNKDFLNKIFTDVQSVKKVLKPMTSSLWSTTYLMAIRESEEFWEGDGDDARTALSALITDPQEWDRIESIALWVWEQRFFHTGYQRKIGGLIAQEMLQRTLYHDGSVNVFSGHDYTLLSVLSNLLPSYCLHTPTSFGGYIMLELWEGVPPWHPGAGSILMGPPKYAADVRVLRVIYNPCPFKDEHNRVCSEVYDAREEVLLELSMPEVEAILQNISDYFAMLA
jgi:hypothetical protein